MLPTEIVSGRTPRVHHASPGPDRWKERSRTYSGIAMARDQREREGEVEIDDVPIISEGDDNGCYVAAWVWVDFSATPYDKEAEPSSPAGGQSDALPAKTT